MYSIKDLEALSGIKAHTIRIWEQRYKFLKPQRTSGNTRYYCCEELKTVLNIALLNKSGFRVSIIDKMSPQEIREKIRELNDPVAIEERKVNELIYQMGDMEALKFEKIIDDYTDDNGIAGTIMNLVFPFLIKTGIFWQNGKINPAQEILVTNILRQKLMVALETNLKPAKKSAVIIFFLPEGEYQELGLLFTYYLFRKKGVDGLYLGANVPLQDLEKVIKNKKPAFVYTHLSTNKAAWPIEKFLIKAAKSFSPAKTIISGNLIEHYSKKVPQGIEFKRSVSSLMEWVARF